MNQNRLPTCHSNWYRRSHVGTPSAIHNGRCVWKGVLAFRYACGPPCIMHNWGLADPPSMHNRGLADPPCIMHNLGLADPPCIMHNRGLADSGCIMHRRWRAQPFLRLCIIRDVHSQCARLPLGRPRVGRPAQLSIMHSWGSAQPVPDYT